MRKSILTLLIVCGVLAATVPAGATPLLSLDTKADWEAAIGGSLVLPEVSTYDALTEHWGAAPFTYYGPQITAMSAAESGEPTDGLMMSWGNDQDIDAQAAGWEYVYPADPNLVGTTLNITVMPPPGIWSIALTLKDAAGGWASWGWNVLGAPAPYVPGVLPAGVPTPIVLDPTLMAPQSGATSFAQSLAPVFSPTTVISISAAELV